MKTFIKQAHKLSNTLPSLKNLCSVLETLAYKEDVGFIKQIILSRLKQESNATVINNLEYLLLVLPMQNRPNYLITKKYTNQYKLNFN